MSRITLANILLAKTPEELEQAKAAHKADLANKPSDSEIITEFLKNCTNPSGEPILKSDEMAHFDNGSITIKKTHS